MQELKFITNLKCNGCIAAITPKLQAIDGIKNWKVNLESPERELKVEGDGDIEKQVTEAVKSAGYSIEKLA